MTGIWREAGALLAFFIGGEMDSNNESEVVLFGRTRSPYWKALHGLHTSAQVAPEQVFAFYGKALRLRQCPAKALLSPLKTLAESVARQAHPSFLDGNSR